MNFTRWIRLYRGEGEMRARNTDEIAQEALRQAARDYADDTGEAVSLVEAALRRLLSEQPSLSCHPLVSGDLRRHIQARSSLRLGRPS